MLSLYSNTPDQLRRVVGERLRLRREARGLKRSQVAVALGYKNLSKGSRRVFDRERGVVGPLMNEAVYVDLLDLPPDQVAGMLDRAAGIEARIQGLGQGVVQAERGLLREHLGLLRGAAARLAATPELGRVRTPAVGFRLLWAGGGALDLAALTGAWAAGQLVADTPEHGAVYLFEGGGSALSGVGRCTGIDGQGALRSVGGSPSRYLGRGGPSPWRDRPRPSPLSLADAVVALGGRAPQSHFHLLDADARPNAVSFAAYDPATRTLRVTGGLAVPVEGAGPPGAAVTVVPEYGGVSVGGGPPRPLSLGQTWHLGGFRAERVVHASGFSLRDGRVQGPDGWLPLQILGPCPPVGVLPLLAALLAQLRGPRPV